MVMPLRASSPATEGTKDRKPPLVVQAVTRSGLGVPLPPPTMAMDPPAAPFHVRYHRLGQPDGAEHLEAPALMQILGRKLHEGRMVGAASTVDHDIDAAKAGHGLVHKVLHALQIGHVRNNAQRVATGSGPGAYRLQGLFSGHNIRRGAGADRDAGAVLSHQAGGGQTNALAAAGDNG